MCGLCVRRRHFGVALRRRHFGVALMLIWTAVGGAADDLDCSSASGSPRWVVLVGCIFVCDGVTSVWRSRLGCGGDGVGFHRSVQVVGRFGHLVTGGPFEVDFIVLV